MLSWVSFSLCLQHYLNYGNVQTTDEAATSPFLSLILSAVGVVTAYMDILIPVPNGAASIAATTAAETVAEAVAGATASTVL